MNKRIYAVIDTNVIVSALLTRNPVSSTILVIANMLLGNIIPVYNEEILEEYKEVLSRSKFNFDSSMVNNLLLSISELGLHTDRTCYPDELPDPKDRVFYEVSITGDSYLVTGNIKHFPNSIRVVTPAEMISILGGEK